MGGGGSAARPDKDIGSELGMFPSMYIGSVPVKHSTGNDICADAVTRVRVRSKTSQITIAHSFRPSSSQSAM